MQIPDWLKIRFRAMLLGFQLSSCYALLFVVLGYLLNLGNDVRPVVLLLWIATGPVLAIGISLGLVFLLPDLVSCGRSGLVLAWTFPLVYGGIHFLGNSVFVESLLGLFKFCRECYVLWRFPLWGYGLFFICSVFCGVLAFSRFARNEQSEY